jgi:hypothetical protein
MSKETFDKFRGDVEEVARFVATFALTMNRKPTDGGWTASQCLAHIADAEISLALRLRMMLTSDDYQFISWDEDAFAVIKEDRDPKISVDTFNSIRKGNLEILESLDSSKLARTGIRPNGEKISVIEYAGYMSQHVRAHLEQAVKAAQA